MDLSLKPRHLARYRDLVELLVKHVGTGGLRPGEEDARKLVDELEAMGPTFVKLGQLLSTRADLLPETYVRALTRLQEHVEPLPFAVVEQVILAELGTKVSAAFGSFDPHPLAAASLGQVHRAALRDGRPVAVKVQRPDIEQRVRDDIEVIEELAAFVDGHTRTGRALGFTGMVEEFRQSLLAELDYRLEAANLREMGRHLAGYRRLVVPQPVDDYTTKVVLTMDFVDGRTVGSLGPLARLEVDGGPLASELFDAYLDQILVHGFVHVDPHPGNLVLTTDGRLALIDLGMTARVAPDLQDALVRLLVALGAHDEHEIAAVLAELGEPRDDWAPDRFAREVADVVRRQRAATVGQLEAGRVVTELARVAADCGLCPPRELTMVSKALLNLDQVACTLDADFEPEAAISRHVAAIMRHKMLQSASPASLLSAAMDAKEFAEKLPSRVNKVMDALAEGQLTLNVQGIDEQELMRGIQKLANRVTTGVVIAALIVGAAMLMRIDTKSKLFGYPTLAIVCFLAAAAAGVWLIANSILHDLPQRRRRR